MGHQTSGNQQILVILVPFADLSFDAESTTSFYLDLFSGTARGTGHTWRKYFQDMSNGALVLDFTAMKTKSGWIWP